MDFGFVSISLLILATVMTLGGLKLLIKKNWLLQFLRGFSGFGLIVFAFIIVMIGVNLDVTNTPAKRPVLLISVCDMRLLPTNRPNDVAVSECIGRIKDKRSIYV